MSMTLTKETLKKHNKLYPTKQIQRSDLEKFQGELNNYLNTINPDESEEHLKKPLGDLLKNAFGYDTNTKESIDYAIYKNKIVEVIIELKKASNTSEMITTGNINKKAFHQPLHYYFQERMNDNLNIKHIIISDGLQWFIFDEMDIAELYKKHGKKYRKWSENRKTGTIYQQFGQWLENEDLPEPIYFNLEDYKDKPIEELPTLYKTLHPDFLLKEFHVRDANELNKDFYDELLYIMGLKEDSKTRKIEIDETIEGSLSHNIVYKLMNDEGFEKGSEKLYETTMELLITWINRILFLKLFETQLVSFNRKNNKQGKDYRFLIIEKIPNHDTLKDYFFEIFGKSKVGEGNTLRKDQFKGTFDHDKLPYLNSSLFEVSELETTTIQMSQLDDKAIIKHYENKKDTNTLQYLFEFLDKYDFSSENNHDEEIVEEKKEDVINPSVLGLIFEKLNGYKDGSFYTPGFITSYIAKETIERAVIDKFNQKYKKAWKSLIDVSNNLDYSSHNLREYNQLVNSVKICDPAVGSGHFLVSALNTLLHIKSQLGILCDVSLPEKQHKDKMDVKRSRMKIEIENDILVVYTENGEQYKYKRGGKDGIQEMIFHEKKTLIENCLFGVDINPNSVHICRLRLWIELLKHTHYIGVGEDDHEMEILPNIDINIKAGNSLISQNPVKVGDSAFLVGNVKERVKELRELTKKYKHQTNKNEKIKIKNRIKELVNVFDEQGQAMLGDTVDSGITNSMEWMLEFPEVLDDKGVFLGFDVVIGNPPYIRQEEIKEFKKNFGNKYKLTTNTSDLYIYFYELSYWLMKDRAFFGFITSNKWMRASYGELLRDFLSHRVNLLSLIDFGGHKVFANATVDTGIFSYQKIKPQKENIINIMKEITGKENFEITSMKQSFLSGDSFVLEDEKILKLKAKIEKKGKPLKDWDVVINRGVLTGYNKAFIIDGATRDELIKADKKNAEIIKPLLRGRDIGRYGYNFADKWLIFIPWHFPLHKDNNISGNSEESEKAFQKNYPHIYNHLLQYKDKLIKRNKDETGIRYEWFALQRCAATYYKDFEKEKVVWQRVTKKPMFIFSKPGEFISDSMAFFVSDKINIKILLGILDSQIGFFYFDSICHQYGDTGYLLSNQYVERLPIPVPTAEQEQQIVALVDKMLANPDDKDTDAQIDQLVYQLYNLTKEEISIVEGRYLKEK